MRTAVALFVAAVAMLAAFAVLPPSATAADPNTPPWSTAIPLAINSVLTNTTTVAAQVYKVVIPAGAPTWPEVMVAATATGETDISLYYTDDDGEVREDSNFLLPASETPTEPALQWLDPGVAVAGRPLYLRFGSNAVAVTFRVVVYLPGTDSMLDATAQFGNVQTGSVLGRLYALTVPATPASPVSVVLTPSPGQTDRYVIEGASLQLELSACFNAPLYPDNVYSIGITSLTSAVRLDLPADAVVVDYGLDNCSIAVSVSTEAYPQDYPVDTPPPFFYSIGACFGASCSVAGASASQPRTGALEASGILNSRGSGGSSNAAAPAAIAMATPMAVAAAAAAAAAMLLVAA